MILLDTHAFYWYITGDSRLPSAVIDLIETNENVYISIASFWEMAIKNSRGNLELPASICDLMKYCGELSISILHMNGLHMDRVRTLPFIHKDPFDRIIIAQAQEERLTIVTVDENITKYSVKTTWN